jgi:hypothetical protein
MTGCGAILVQEGKPIAYFSSKFSGAEVNYTTTEQEMLGVVKSLKAWRCYLEGCNGLTIVTDHNPLTYLPTQHLLSRRQARWMEFMSRFQYVWKHTPGIHNPADPLSRICFLAALYGVSCNMLESPHDVVKKIPNSYQHDEQFNSREFIYGNGMEWPGNGFWMKGDKVVIPRPLVREAISAHHDALQAGHFGQTKTQELVFRDFWWPSMKEDVIDYVRNCPSCQRSKSSTQKPYGQLQPLPIPDDRWEVVSLDFITGLPRTPSGHDAIIVFVDKLTKRVLLAATTKTCTAARAAKLFIQHVECKQGTPRVLISDRDSRFTSEYWRALHKHLGVTLAFSSAYHPQSDGQTERANKVIGEVFRDLSAGVPAWDDLLPSVEFSINNSKSASTKETPFFLNYGCHPRTHIRNQLPDGFRAIPPLKKAQFRDRDEALARVKLLLVQAQARQKSYSDQHRQPLHLLLVTMCS